MEISLENLYVDIRDKWVKVFSINRNHGKLHCTFFFHPKSDRALLPLLKEVKSSRDPHKMIKLRTFYNFFAPLRHPR